MNVFVSPFQNPFINLALEDYFLRESTRLPMVFFYVNRPCVVLGRFQNPWLECHLPYLVQEDIWLVRRQSGGGCVFHDEGNLNFSFITPDGMIDRKKHAELMQRAFAKVDIELQISPRNDLWLADQDGMWKKISGSAYKQTKSASFHHGTFLVSSDLNRLEESLKHTVIPKTSKSIASVRSQVITLQQRFPHVEIPDVIEIVANEIQRGPEYLDASFLSMNEVQESFRNLTSWDWLWGETPAFEMETSKGELKIHKGLIKGPFEGKFSKEVLKDFLHPDELEKLFPDFDQQRNAALGVF
jgi:lipoate-protein ligase A